MKISTYCVSSTHDLRVAERSDSRGRGGGEAGDKAEKEIDGTEVSIGQSEKEQDEEEEEDTTAAGIQDYIMYMGQDGVYTHTFEYAKKPVSKHQRRRER